MTSNRSCSYQANIAIICAIGMVSMIAGIGFSLAGAWLVLPFVVLEFMLLVTVLHFFLRRLRRSQLLIFGPRKIIVEKAFSRTVIERERAKIVVESPSRHTDWPRLLLIGEGRTIELGGFLNEDDSRLLQQVLCQEIGLQTVRSPDCQQQEF